MISIHYEYEDFVAPMTATQWHQGTVRRYQEDGEDETFTVIGTLDVAIIDLYDLRDESLLEALDGHSSEWSDYYNYLTVGKEIEAFSEKYLDSSDAICRLLIFDSMRLDEDERGKGLGLHLLARALRTFQQSTDLSLLTAGSLEKRERRQDDEAASLAATEKLANYWSRLDFTRIEDSAMMALHGALVHNPITAYSEQVFI